MINSLNDTMQACKNAVGEEGCDSRLECGAKRPSDPALVLLAKIVNGADTDNSLWNQPEAAGLNAIAEGFRQLGYKDDAEMIAAEWIVYDALYAYCQEMVRRGKPDGQFR